MFGISMRNNNGTYFRKGLERVGPWTGGLIRYDLRLPMERKNEGGEVAWLVLHWTEIYRAGFEAEDLTGEETEV